MSESSGASSGTSGGRFRCEGIPLKCWCNNGIVTRMSKSEQNPSRRYFRCEIASTNKMVNDNHVFKWVDEALVFEVNNLKRELDAVKNEIKEYEKVMEALYEKVEYGLLEEKKGRDNMMKKVVTVMVLAMVFWFGVSKLS